MTTEPSTHERECPHGRFALDSPLFPQSNAEPEHCGYCFVSRMAYIRGHKDATRELTVRHNDHLARIREAVAQSIHPEVCDHESLGIITKFFTHDDGTEKTTAAVIRCTDCATEYPVTVRDAEVWGDLFDADDAACDRFLVHLWTEAEEASA